MVTALARSTALRCTLLLIALLTAVAPVTTAAQEVIERPPAPWREPRRHTPADFHASTMLHVLAAVSAVVGTLGVAGAGLAGGLRWTPTPDPPDPTGRLVGFHLSLDLVALGVGCGISASTVHHDTRSPRAGRRVEIGVASAIVGGLGLALLIGGGVDATSDGSEAQFPFYGRNLAGSVTATVGEWLLSIGLGLLAAVIVLPD